MRNRGRLLAVVDAALPPVVGAPGVDVPRRVGRGAVRAPRGRRHKRDAVAQRQRLGGARAGAGAAAAQRPHAALAHAAAQHLPHVQAARLGRQVQRRAAPHAPQAVHHRLGVVDRDGKLEQPRATVAAAGWARLLARRRRRR